MKTIQQIIMEMDENTKMNFESTVDNCLKAMESEKIKWREFKVYQSSVRMMKVIINAPAPEFIIAIADKANIATNVKILIKKEKENAVETINLNRTEMMAIISISEKEL